MRLSAFSVYPPILEEEFINELPRMIQKKKIYFIPFFCLFIRPINVDRQYPVCLSGSIDVVRT